MVTPGCCWIAGGVLSDWRVLLVWLLDWRVLSRLAVGCWWRALIPGAIDCLLDWRAVDCCFPGARWWRVFSGWLLVWLPRVVAVATYACEWYALGVGV